MVEVEPYVALMRRYCIDYTTVHDASVCDDIMREDYTVTVSGRTLEMPEYRAAVQGAFRWFPTLSLSVHELVLSGDRLAMRFSEHGASAKHDGRVAVWQGISLYRWDGQRLAACDVEQDFSGRERQLATRPDPLDTVALDPWADTRDLPANPAAEALVTDWLQAWATRRERSRLEAATFRLHVDDSDHVGPDDLVLGEPRLEVPDLFSAGDAVAARVVVSGAYDGGLPGVDDDGARGRACELPATVLAHVEGDRVADVRVVRDRWGLQRRLR